MISFRADEALHKRLKAAIAAAAAKQPAGMRIKKSDVLRAAVEQYVDKVLAQEAPSSSLKKK